jgi:hypothetical protein
MFMRWPSGTALTGPCFSQSLVALTSTNVVPVRWNSPERTDSINSNGVMVSTRPSMMLPAIMPAKLTGSRAAPKGGA